MTRRGVPFEKVAKRTVMVRTEPFGEPVLALRQQPAEQLRVVEEVHVADVMLADIA